MEFVTKLARIIINTCEIPDLFKHGIIIPVHKAFGQPILIQMNYSCQQLRWSCGKIHLLSQFRHTSFLYNCLYIRFSYESYIILMCKPEYMIFICVVSYEFYIIRFI